MRIQHWRRAMAVAAAGAALSTPTLVAPAQADVAAMSFYGYDGSSMVADTIAESIVQGNTLSAALTLAQSLASLTDPQTLVAITDALVNPPDLFDPETAVTELLSISGSLASDTLGDAVGPSVAAAAATSNKGQGHGKKVTVQPATADQYDNGETKAMNYHRWLHHGSDSVRIYLGHCNSSGCATDGYFLEDYSANTYYAYEFQLFDTMSSGSISANFTNYSAVLRRDINNWPDSTTDTFSNCGSGAYSYFHCAASAGVPGNNSNWYYEQVNFRASYGADVADVQIQTRRAQLAGSSLSFQIYASGG